MLFESTENFLELCISKQENLGFDRFITSAWIYDPNQNIAQTTLIDPILETKTDVKLRTSRTELDKLTSQLETRYSAQIDKRIGNFGKPVIRYVAEYPTWDEFRNNWIVHQGNNATRVAIPALIDSPHADSSTTKHAATKITLYIVDTEEFYNFRISKHDNAQFIKIKADLKDTVRDAYAST